MPKITFMGAGSSIFAKNILGDCMLTESLCRARIALYDIDAGRLRESRRMLAAINKNVNSGRARISVHCGVEQRRTALKDADYVVNAINVGGYDPATIIDFELPKRYGLRQTIADTTGIGGIFRALRTIPVILDFARDMQAVCPQALMLNYANPMPTVSTAMTRAGGIRYVGLCHSVQVCARAALQAVGLEDKYPPDEVRQWVAGINHMGWLLKISHRGKDLYPAIKTRARKLLREIARRGGARAVLDNDKLKRLHPAARESVRLEIMLRFGYFNSESPEHSAEYHPYFIRKDHPELIDRYAIPLDEYPRRCVRNIEHWKTQAKDLVRNPKLRHERTQEYGSRIMAAMQTGVPTQVGGNVLNTGLITNLPRNMAVEVPCLVDANGVQGCYVGDLPEPCAALNRTNINVHLLAVEAILERRKDALVQAALLDPHARSELTIDETVKLVDALIKAHGKMLPRLR